jgi:predicted metal-binding membrane protein
VTTIGGSEPAAGPAPALERLVRRDRAAAAIGLLVLAAIAWASLLRMRSEMGGAEGSGTAMPGMAMPDMAMRGWSTVEFLLLFLMWATMMVAMMLPSAAPMILLMASVQRRRRERASPAVPTAIFAAGYLLVWTGFSAGAALLQWALHQAALLSPAMASTSPLLGGVFLVTAGLYQWLPLKSACLGHCRSPMDMLSREWREGSAGALVMGIRHGVFCLGCCWALMLLLFVAGVMDLRWVAAIGALVLIEKVARGGAWVGKVAGLGLVAWGGWMVLSGG